MISQSAPASLAVAAAAAATAAAVDGRLCLGVRSGGAAAVTEALRRSLWTWQGRQVRTWASDGGTAAAAAATCAAPLLLRYDGAASPALATAAAGLAAEMRAMPSGAHARLQARRFSGGSWARWWRGGGTGGKGGDGDGVPPGPLYPVRPTRVSVGATGYQ